MIRFVLPLFIFCVSSMGIMIIADTTSSQTEAANNTGARYDSNSKEKSLMNMSMDGHQHGILDVASMEKVPAVSMTVTEDPYANGWNIHLKTFNFTFTPENANLENVDNEGHAHLYIDGKKIARLYSPWNYVFDLPPGPHTFRVTLNSNNHSEFTYEGKPIEAVTSILQKDTNYVARE